MKDMLSSLEDELEGAGDLLESGARADDIASVGYWYQREPHAPFPEMPPIHERWSR